DLGNFNYKDFHHWIGAMGTLCISVRPGSPIKDGHDLIKFLKEKGVLQGIAKALFALLGGLAGYQIAQYIQQNQWLSAIEQARKDIKAGL
uniref:hypothetical protein n=1 Tax=Acetomicrobium sp. S15 = DSM 107314 TaxID=2529858 RepID=UPI0018E132A6